MKNLLKSEFRKLFYTKTFYLAGLGAIAISVLSALPASYALVKLGKSIYSGASLMDPGMVDGVYSKGTSGYIFALILGISLMAGEYQSGMATTTFLATPQRGRVVWVKFLTASFGGTIIMYVSTWLGAYAAWYGMRAYPHVAPSGSLFVNIALTPIISGSVLAIIGVSIGTLIRNVRIATTGALIWMMVIERLIVIFWPTGGKWLPTGAIVGMFNLKLTLRSSNSALNFNMSNYFNATTSIALLLGYAILFALLGRAFSLKRDIN